jgi:hypothetical protein
MRVEMETMQQVHLAAPALMFVNCFNGIVYLTIRIPLTSVRCTWFQVHTKEICPITTDRIQPAIEHGEIPHRRIL